MRSCGCLSPEGARRGLVSCCGHAFCSVRFLGFSSPSNKVLSCPILTSDLTALRAPGRASSSPSENVLLSGLSALLAQWHQEVRVFCPSSRRTFRQVEWKPSSAAEGPAPELHQEEQMNFCGA